MRTFFAIPFVLGDGHFWHQAEDLAVSDAGS
jgi:hypothetical protein